MTTTDSPADTQVEPETHEHDDHQCKYRSALEELDRMNPNDFKSHQSHLLPAFRTVDFQDAFRHVISVVNKVLHNTDENGRPLPQ